MNGRPWCIDRIVGCIILIFCGIIPGSAQSISPSRQVIVDGAVEMTVEVDRAETLVAQPVVLTIQVDAPDQTRVTLPSVQQELGDFSVISIQTIGPLPAEDDSDRRRWLTTIGLETIESGSKRIPSLTTIYRLPEKLVEDRVVTSEPISIEVRSALDPQADPMEYRDLKDVIDPPVARSGGTRIVWITIGAIGLIVFVACLFVWKLRTPSPAADRWAVEEIRRIEAAYRDRTLDVIQVHDELSNIVRLYIEAIDGVAATAMSSDELNDQVKRAGWPEIAIQSLDRFLQTANELKFAGVVQGQAEVADSFRSCRTIIEATAPGSQLKKRSGAVDGINSSAEIQHAEQVGPLFHPPDGRRQDQGTA